MDALSPSAQTLTVLQDRVRERSRISTRSTAFRAGAVVVSFGLPRADPIIGLIITLIILRITWASWRTISTTEPGEMLDNP